MSTIATPMQNMRRKIVQMFPWLTGFVAVASAKGKGLAIRTASGLLHLAGGPDDPAVHRVGDAGTAGSLTAPAALVLTTPGGAIATITATANLTTGIVVFQINGGSGPFTIDTKATTGSEKVTSG